jgi:hypothetical protein
MAPMTRATLRRSLRRVYVLLTLVLLWAFVAKLADRIPGLEAAGLVAPLSAAYDLVRDMSLLIATGGVAYITNLFQQRSAFVTSLREEWREIIETKSALYAYSQLEAPRHEEYVATFCKLSETIDNMRTVYRNVGETEGLIGLYPYAPLHDMRRVLQTLDPRKRPNVPEEERRLARDAMLASFYALRETFLEELDLEEPSHPLLIYAGRRLKRSGTTARAGGHQESQRRRQERLAAPNPEIDALLTRLYEQEQTTPRRWRSLEGGNGGEPARSPGELQRPL